MSPSRKRGGNPDRNQKEIVEALRKLGAVVLIITQVPNCFDILVFHKGRCIPVEIKQPKGKLTPGESDFKRKIESRGVKYNIVRSISEAIELINGSHMPEILKENCPQFPPCINDDPHDCEWCAEHFPEKYGNK